jgi:hypothetical protein
MDICLLRCRGTVPPCLGVFPGHCPGLATWPKEAEARPADYRLARSDAIGAAQFIRWVEGGNA